MPVPLTPESRPVYKALSLALVVLPGFDWCDLWSPGPPPVPTADDYIRLLELTEQVSALARAALASGSSAAGAAAVAAIAPKPQTPSTDEHPPQRIELKRLVAEYEPADTASRGLRRRTP